MKTRSLLTSVFTAIGLVAAAWAAAPAEPGSGGGTRLFLLTGQSNSLGAVKGTPAPPELLEKYRSEAKMWNGNMVRDTGVCFEKNPTWQAVEPQLPNYNGNNCMGPEYGFCHMLERRAPKLFKGKLGVIKASLDGGGNHYWLKGGKAYNSLLSSVTAAMKARKGGRIVGLIYLQGESDAGEEVTQAGKRFMDLVANLRKDTKAKKMTLCMVGQPATWHGKDTTVNGTTTAAELESLAAKNKDVSFIRTRDLTKISRGDGMGVHYDGKSQITIGARYAYAVLRSMQLPLPGRVRSDRADVTLDNAAAWWQDAKETTPAPAVWDVAAANTEETLDKAWAVPGIRVEDPFRSEVLICGKGSLGIGSEGIVLQDADLRLVGVKLELTAPQTWQIPAGRTLKLENTAISGTAAGQITLQGEGTLELSGAATSLRIPNAGKVSIRQAE